MSFGLGHGHGIGAAVPNPEKSLEGWAGLISWVDPVTAAVTYNTQPTIPGAGWSGANWSGSALGPYTHTPGATTDLAQAIEIIGNRYETTYTVSGRTAGQVTHKDGTTAGTARTANGVYTDAQECAGSTGSIWTPDTSFDGAVTVGSIVNMSVASVPERVGGGSFAQSTATLMPYLGPGKTIRLDADWIQSQRAASTFSCLHNGTGGTLCMVVYSDLSLARWSVGNMAANTQVGIGTTLNTNGSIRVVVANGSGTWALDYTTATGIMVAYAKSILIYRWSGGNLQLWVNGVKRADQAVTSPSAAAPTNALVLGGAGSGASALVGGISDTLVFNRNITDPERAWLEALFAKKWSITI